MICAVGGEYRHHLVGAVFFLAKINSCVDRAPSSEPFGPVLLPGRYAPSVHCVPGPARGAASSPSLATPAPQGDAAQPLGRAAHPATTTSTPRDALRATLPPEHPEGSGDAFKGHASEQPAGMSCEPPLAL